MSNPHDPTEPYGQQPPYGDQPAYGQQPTYGRQPGYGQEPGYGSPTPYGQPSGFFAPQLPKHPSATTSMVLGIVGLAGIAFACGITLFLSPFAWRMGAKAVREIDANPQHVGGRAEANTGRITGLIGTILLGLAILGVVLLLASVFWLVPEPSTTYDGTSF